MAKNYSFLVDRVKSRSNPENLSYTKLFGEDFNRDYLNVSGNKILEYIKLSMQGVGKEYTDKSFQAGDAVKTHLSSVLSSVNYEYQGSVMTNTHIKGNSDIDLLVISNRSYFFDYDIKSKYEETIRYFNLNESQKQRVNEHLNATSYSGNTLQDLRNNRINSETKLESVYTIFNNEKPKCIQITNQNVHRDVDIVFASWHKTFEGLKEANNKKNKIKIYDYHQHELGRVESPFISIDLINTKDAYVNGRLKKMIRFIKTIKADSEVDINLSSFDINAICFNIPIDKYQDKIYSELVKVIYDEFCKIITDENYRNSIKSVDGSEFIFYGKEDKLLRISQIVSEIDYLRKELEKNTLITRIYS
ncbi:nucleotidyltransferase domain-containing protein [Myroides sp. ZB35]|uniref:nucleotidyltransferase domain-containing protein n=1 Tax=Myroides sp. ZB35 TaxID=1458492 RepID=UPI0008F490E4|nr:nucleotidyltransferase domain-containing protein [Myroides sp. ZB35]APA92223.1 hypothetical protein BK054_08290 [Myroides sp. ZB35]